MADNKPTGPYTERNWRMLTIHLRVIAFCALAFAPLVFLDHWKIALALPLVMHLAFELYCRVQKRHAIYHLYGQITTTREGSEWAAEKFREYFAKWDRRRSAQWWIQQFTHGFLAMGGHKGRFERNDPGSIRIRHHHFGDTDSDPVDAKVLEASILASMKRVLIGSQPGGPELVGESYRESGMAIPSVSEQFTEAVSRGTAGICIIGTGEGGLWEEHLAGGPETRAEVQVGTSNFACRNPDGTFNLELHAATMADPRAVATQVKLSQGAKQDGGNAPGWKVYGRVAKKRGIPEGKDCRSPARNPSIPTIAALVEFVRTIRARTGKVVGVKMAIGSFAEFDAMCAAWAACPEGMPDYLQIDGGEGGTGAAYEEMMKCGGLDASTAIQVADLLLRKHKLRTRVRIVGSAGGFYPEDLIRMHALGADIVASGRGFKYMVGCIGASKCHIGRELSAVERLVNVVRKLRGMPPLGPRGECPTGIAGNGEVINPVERGVWVRAAVTAMYQRTAHLLVGTGLDSLDKFVGSRLRYIELIGVHIWTLRQVEDIIAIERSEWTLDTPAIPESERSA